MKRGFTLLELLVVIVIIGILSVLGYSSINELIQTNRAKEAARLITTFVERSLAEGKMRKDSVTITITGSTINARIGTFETSEAVSNGFSASNSSMPDTCEAAATNKQITSVPDITAMFKIGNDIKLGPVCFAVCNNSGSYCGGTLKVAERNYFTAKIKKKNSWGAL